MEPLAALGLACNVFQLISLGYETVHLVRDVYRSGSAEAPLAEHAATLREISSYIGNLAPSSNKHEAKLKENAVKCHGVARDLEEEIRFLLAESAKGSLINALKTAAKTSWRKRRLDRFEKQLRDLEAQMQIGLLARVCDAALKVQTGQETLNEDVRRFLDQYRAGERRASELIVKSSNAVSERVALESAHIQRRINDESKTIAARVNKAAELSVTEVTSRMVQLGTGRAQSKLDSRLIESLIFPGMNERRNQVEEPHEGTSRWIYSEDDPEHERPWDNFRNWLRSTEQVYWISGKPGSGKTTIAKYILKDVQTAECLDVWQPNCLVVSHFFWRPGTRMQHSLKGMFCSILQQLLLHNPSLADVVASRVPGITSKRQDTDWSLSELQQSVSSILEQSTRPVFFLLDGLDEIDPLDGVLDLLASIDAIREDRNIKMCLLSRPEPLLQKRLSEHPKLRLQDFTLEDLRQYAQDKLFPALRGSILEEEEDLHLEEWLKEIRRGQRREALVDGLVAKSEGVFLWLHLSVNSILRGIGLDDTLDDLRRRVDSLPGTIADLYNDMWQRMNEDTTSHRHASASYLKMILLSKRLPRLRCSSLFRMALAISQMGEKILSIGPNAATVAALVKQCMQTEREVKQRCAGLVELVRVEQPNMEAFSGTWAELSTESVETKETTDRDRKLLLGYLRCDEEFSFIHRSAQDFLMDTVEGQMILSQDTSTDVEISCQLISASLAACRFCNLVGFPEARDSIKFYDGRYRYPILNCSEVFLEAISLILSDDARHHPRNQTLSPTVKVLIGFCEQLSISGEMKSEYSTKVSGACSRQEFVEQAVFYLGFDVAQLYAEETRQCELSSMFLAACQQCLFQRDKKGLAMALGKLAQLLSVYEVIDVNWKAPCRYKTGWFYPKHFVSLTPLTVVLMVLLEQFTSYSRTTEDSPSDTLLLGDQAITTLAAFIRRGADLTEELYMVLNHLKPGHWSLRRVSENPFEKAESFPQPFSLERDLWQGATLRFSASIAIRSLLRAIVHSGLNLDISRDLRTVRDSVDSATFTASDPRNVTVVVTHPGMAASFIGATYQSEFTPTLQSSFLVDVFDKYLWQPHDAQDWCDEITSRFQNHQRMSGPFNVEIESLGWAYGNWLGFSVYYPEKLWREQLVVIGALEITTFTDDSGNECPFHQLPGVREAEKHLHDALENNLVIGGP